MTDELNGATAVVWRRLPYLLSPQMDIYERLPNVLAGVVGVGQVLEVGFGTGIGVLQYANTVDWIDAIEIDPAAVRFAQKCFPLPNVRWLQGDILGAGGELTHYGFAVMIEVLEHIHDTDRALNALALLADRALITVPNAIRYRQKDERLNEHEWTPATFPGILKRYFGDVKLLNYQLNETEDLDSRETPIIALCSSAS